MDERLIRWHDVTFIDSHGTNRPWTLSSWEWLREAQLETGPGKCAFCERRLKRKAGGGRIPMICFRVDCQEEFYREHRRMLRERVRR